METDILTQANQSYASFDSEERRALVAQALSYSYDDDGRDEAIDRLEEEPLSVSKIVTYHRHEETEWEILLGTGGPVRRILVRTDYLGSIQSASFQYQDWFTPWVDAENQDEEFVADYARIVGYYEED